MKSKMGKVEKNIALVSVIIVLIFSQLWFIAWYGYSWKYTYIIESILWLGLIVFLGVIITSVIKIRLKRHKKK